MTDMRFRLTSNGGRTVVTNATTGEMIPCTRVEFRHEVGSAPVLSLDIPCSDIEADIAADGEASLPPVPSPRAIEDEQAAAYDRTWGRR